MKIVKWVFFLVIAVGTLAGGLHSIFLSSPPDPAEKLYLVERPAKKEIKQTISAVGKLKLKDQIKIGSLVAGRIEAIYVEENDEVVEGQLLMKIDTGLGDTEVREAKGHYEKAVANLEYQEKRCERQTRLFQERLIPEAEWQEATCGYRSAHGEVVAAEAEWEKKGLAYRNSQIFSPSPGVILHIEVAKGEKVGTDPEGGTLLSLAPDVKQIEVELDIHERDIGQIRKNQKLHMVVDTYPYKIFESVIHSIGFMSKPSKEKECLYLAKAYIDNLDLLLRPGMSVQGTIDVEAAEGVLTLTSKPFIIKEEHLLPVAELLGYAVQPIDRMEKLSLLSAHPDQHTQFVWLVEEKVFREIPVEIGISDNIYFQVKSGLSGEENLVAEVTEKDKMQEIYEKFYRKL